MAVMQVPGEPISPSMPIAVMVAVVVGFVLAVVTAFGVEYIDNRIKSPQELRATLAIPFLGMIPGLSHDKQARKNPLLIASVPQNFAEAFRTLRANILFSSADEGMRSLVITSAGPGEGKSLVASNLSVALAQAGQRVLLIDADMRRPRIHEIFDSSQEPGLSNVLSERAQTSDAIKKSGVAGLWLLNAGRIPPNPGELLGSRRCADFLASLSAQFDWVVLDTPPVMVVTDSTIVAKRASGVVFVVAAESTSRNAARAAVEQLSAADAHLLGSVLNHVDVIRKPGDYFAYYYRNEYTRYHASASGLRGARLR